MRKRNLKKFLAGVVVFILVTISLISTSGKIIDKSPFGSLDTHTYYVGGTGAGNYSKIQDAIDNASGGDVIFVYNGTYCENIVIDRIINLVGEDRHNTIITGGGQGDVICILENVSGVSIVEFTIMFCGSDKWFDAGIKIHSSFNEIRDNIIAYNNCGISLVEKEQDVEYNIITRNNINNNSWFGIRIEDSNYNAVFNNYIADNNHGLFIEPECLPRTKDTHPSRFFEDEIHSNVIKNNNVGIEISHSWGMNISKNDIINNDLGIRIFGSYGWGGFNRIHQNNIIDNVNGIIIDCLSGGATNNVITHNNFISNMQNAYFCSDNNRWEENYWGRPRLLPKVIRGRYRFDTPIQGFNLPWINIDWDPAQKPFEI